MNGLQQRCIGFSRHLRTLALKCTKSTREQRRLLRGAVSVQGYADLLGGEVTPSSTRLFHVACDEYLKTLARAGLAPKRVGNPSDSSAQKQNQGNCPVVQGIVVLFFPMTKHPPSKPKGIPVKEG